MSPIANNQTVDSKQALTKSLENIGAFSSQERDLIFEHCQQKTIKKQEALLETGQICDSASFLIKGACYQYSLNETEESIIELYTENDCMIHQASFTFQKPANETIKAFVDCEVLVLNIHALHKLIAASPVFFQLGKMLHVASFRLSYIDKNLTPLEKYQHVMQYKPQLLQAFPLKYIASYLKITPETLSRVRAQS